uniref:ANK_REP_REGION domain-containing protein n=2 Tax=Macrostomum lignano TaxID=282301 RepID=A0A1I8FUG1_9PLAT
ADPDKLRAHLTGGQSPDQMFNFNGSCLSPLHLACITGNYQAAQLLTRSSKQPEVNVNRQSSHGESPLFVASAYGHDRLVSSLILQGANVDLPQKLGCTPLWVAAQNGHRAVVQLLIEAQANNRRPVHAALHGRSERTLGNCHQLVSAMADVDAQKTDGCSPMYIAAQNGHRQVVAALLKAQTTLDLQQERGRTAIYAAAQEGHAEVVEVLSRAAADVNIQQVDGATPLLIATQFGHRQIVRCLLELGVPDVNLAEFSGATPMYIASQEGHALVQAMADIDQAMLNGSTPLYAAVQNGRKLVVQELIKAKAAVQPETAHLCTPLYGAFFLGDRSIVDSLLKLGANPNLDCGISVIQPALHVAVHCNQLPIVLSLIKAQVDVNQIGELGTTALYTAAQENHWKIARALVEVNADADATSHPEGAAPIHIASQLGHHRIVQLLAKVALADVNLRLSSGCTALHLASQAGHAASVKILLSVPQIDMNLTDSTGCSALLAASREGHTNTVDLLLAAGAVPELKAHDGITPMLISALNGHRKVLDRLTSYRSTMKLSVDNYFPASTASEQSLLVHQSMLRAGFTRPRAALQTAAAEVLHQLVSARSRCDKENKIFVMGSFAEGWGSCMASLNGDIDPDSDIDYLMIDTNQLFHLKNYCRCRHPDPASVKKTVEYCNGEITCDDFASNCSTKHVETGNKSLGPAIHLETALSLCCHPPMAVLQSQNDSNISQRVLDLLRQEITSTPCHLVRAASPGSAGSQFR